MFILREYKFPLCLASGCTQLTQDAQVTFTAPPSAPPPPSQPRVEWVCLDPVNSSLISLLNGWKEGDGNGRVLSETAVVVIRWTVWLANIYSGYNYSVISSSDWWLGREGSLLS